MMSYRLSQLSLLGLYILLHCIELVVTFNVTNGNKLLCYSCKGPRCETISNDEDSVVLCNKHTQLCWAGFVDQQAYRTCASRYCTPSGISLDSDIRIETCCHSSLCNSLSLSWSIWSKWYTKSTTHAPAPPTTSSTKVTTQQITTPTPTPTTTTTQSTMATPQIYIVNEIVNQPQTPPVDNEDSDEQSDIVLSNLQLNSSDPARFGINWQRIPYEKGFSNRVVSISKLIILSIPVLLVLLF